jgi:hypothetical protein
MTLAALEAVEKKSKSATTSTSQHRFNKFNSSGNKIIENESFLLGGGKQSN